MLPNPEQRQALLSRRARKWRFISLGAGLLLAASFFMPAVNGCNTPVIPAKHAHDGLQAEWIEWPGVFYCFVAAYLFGSLVALGAAARLWARRRAEQGVRASVLTLLGAGCFVVFISFGWSPYSNMQGWSTGGLASLGKELWNAPGISLVTGVCPLVGLLYLWRLRCPRGQRWLGYVFFSSLWCFVWFGMWLPGCAWSDVHYGLLCSFTGSVAICLAVVGETAALTEQSYFRAMGGLFLARIPLLAVERELCRGCGYSRVGLRDPRCPECGRAFDWAEVGLEPAPRVDPGATTPA